MNKDKIKNIILVMLVAVVSSALTSFLTTNTLSGNKLLGSVSYSDYLDSSKVTYLDSNVQDSIDNLYTKASDYTKIRNMIYPVGSIYISVTDDTVAKVQARFGGEWESFGEGKTLVGVDTSDNDFNSIEKTGGAKTKSYTPSGTVGNTTLTLDQIPSHSHINWIWFSGNGNENVPGWTVHLTNAQGDLKETPQISSTLGRPITLGESYRAGGGESHTHSFTGTSENINVTQPYITVYMYKRVS